MPEESSPPLADDVGYTSESRKRVWFVTSNLSITLSLPVEVIPGHILRRPFDEEIARIHSLLSRFTAPHRIGFECDWEASGDGKGEQSVQLPQDQWRYHVVEPPQHGDALADGSRVIDWHQHLIERAGRLCDVEFAVGATLFPAGSSYDSFGPLAEPLYGPRFRPKIFTEGHLKQLRESYDGLGRVAARFSDIERAADMFLALRRVQHGELYALGVFAIIESLLTHNPVGDYDSLTHQISTKFPLLSRRMPLPIDYSAFPDASDAQIWKMLYQYRSAIAHGSQPDFAGKLKRLKNADLVREFLDAALKALLRFALNEPRLVNDLRAV
jgi:hypothetical protein